MKKEKILTFCAVLGVVLTIAIFANSLAQQNRMINNEVARARFGAWATIR